MKTPPCPTCTGRDPHRSADVVVMTGPDKRGSARAREAWRAFWRYRAEEISAAWRWLPDIAQGTVVVTFFVALIGSAIIGLVAGLGAHYVEECESRCAMLGVEGVFIYERGCYCVIDGAPQRWEDIGRE